MQQQAINCVCAQLFWVSLLHHECSVYFFIIGFNESKNGSACIRSLSQTWDLMPRLSWLAFITWRDAYQPTHSSLWSDALNLDLIVTNAIILPNLAFNKHFAKIPRRRTGMIYDSHMCDRSPQRSFLLVNVSALFAAQQRETKNMPAVILQNKI